VAVLLVKIVFGPALVIGASLAARRFGSRVGGIVGGIPAITGAILLVLALDQGARFASQAAAASLLGMVGTLAFVLTYAGLSHRFAWPAALVGGLAMFAPVVAVLRPFDAGPFVAVLIAPAAITLTLVLLQRTDRTPSVQRASQPRWDLALRVVCTIVPIVAITAAAKTLGPQLSGVAAAFPVVTPVLAAFTHSQLEATEARRVLHGLTGGLVSYAVFCFTVSVALRGLGTGEAFLLAVAAMVVVQSAMLLFARRSSDVAAEAPSLTPAA
jgi:hypothetical protein